RPDRGSATDRSAPGTDLQTVRGATGDARPMDERSDAAEPPPATLARDRARPLSAQRSPTPTRPSPRSPSATAGGRRPRAAQAPGAPRPAGPGSGADREGAVSAPTATSTLEAAARQQPAPGVPPPRSPVTGQRPGLVSQLVL